MLGARARLCRGQPGDLSSTPFILAGAMAPVTAAGVVAADPGRGAGRDDLRPARPARVRRWSWAVRQLDVDADRRADVRHAGAGARPVRDGRLARRTRRARSAPAGACAPRRSPTPRPAYESRCDTLQPTVLAGVNFVLHAAGWLEGGLAVGYEKFILDADQCGMMQDSPRGST